MNITMTDVARAAGVSVATVGRVLHKNGYVSEAVRARVEEAVRTLGYVPNQSARILKCSRSGILGSLVLQNPNGLYYRINASILQAAQQHGYEVVTMEAQGEIGNEGSLIRNFIGLQVDGLVITSNSNIKPEMLMQLKQAGIPVVAVERGYLEEGVDSLLVRDFEAVRDTVLRLAEKGHRRVALIAANKPLDVERRRIAGYLHAVQEAGLSGDKALLRGVASYAPAFGRQAAEALFSLPEPPTAIVCAADTLAAGVLQAAYARRLRVPEDVSLVGYDDVLSSSLSPEIDSVGLLLDGIGETVMALLEARRAAPDKPAECRDIETVYVERGSVAQL